MYSRSDESRVIRFTFDYFYFIHFLEINLIDIEFFLFL